MTKAMLYIGGTHIKFCFGLAHLFVPSILISLWNFCLTSIETVTLSLGVFFALASQDI
jgi:hypothetical protein